MKTLTALPRNVRLNDVRQTKKSLFASLSPLAVELLDTASAPGGHVFGGKGPRVILSRGKTVRMVDDGMMEVRTLMRAGWLRFAPSPMDNGHGYYWLTDSAERVWSVLGRLPR